MERQRHQRNALPNPQNQQGIKKNQTICKQRKRQSSNKIMSYIHKKARSSSELSEMPASAALLSFKADRAMSTVVSTKSRPFFLMPFMYPVFALPQRSRENRYGALVTFPVTLLSTLGSLMFNLPRAEVDAKTSSTLISPSEINVTARSSYVNYLSGT